MTYGWGVHYDSVSSHKRVLVTRHSSEIFNPLPTSSKTCDLGRVLLRDFGRTNWQLWFWLFFKPAPLQCGPCVPRLLKGLQEYHFSIRRAICKNIFLFIQTPIVPKLLCFQGWESQVAGSVIPWKFSAHFSCLDTLVNSLLFVVCHGLNST